MSRMSGSAVPPVTFAGHVAAIVFEHCASCHRRVGPAPFSLLTYEDVRHRAERIAAVTASRYMPPWKTEPGYGDFDLGASRIERTSPTRPTSLHDDVPLLWAETGRLEVSRGTLRRLFAPVRRWTWLAHRATGAAANQIRERLRAYENRTR